MIRGFLEAAKLQDNPVNQLCKHMDWSLVFTQEDLGNLNIFLSLMGPSEFLFSKLNSEKESTLHLCYPIVQVMPTFYYVIRHNTIFMLGAPLKTFHHNRWWESPSKLICQGTGQTYERILCLSPWSKARRLSSHLLGSHLSCTSAPNPHQRWSAACCEGFSLKLV